MKRIFFCPIALLTFSRLNFSTDEEPKAISQVDEPIKINCYLLWCPATKDAAYVGRDFAVGEFDIGVVSTGEPENNLPREYGIEQNYPNPFNPVTTIRYSMPKEGLLLLKFYNAIGEEIKTLVNEIKQPGNYSVNLDGTNLSSCVYFYRIHAGSFIETRKMVLLK